MDFEDIYKKYGKDVFAFSLSLCQNRALAEDLTSETFLKAMDAAKNFQGKSTVKVWLCQIAKNTYYDYLRKHARHTELTDDIPTESDIENKLIDHADALEIYKLLHRLSEPYKEVFSLRVFSELSFAEIGGIFEKTESWARVTFHRGKQKITGGMA